MRIEVAENSVAHINILLFPKQNLKIINISLTLSSYLRFFQKISVSEKNFTRKTILHYFIFLFISHIKQTENLDTSTEHRQLISL